MFKHIRDSASVWQYYFLVWWPISFVQVSESVKGELVTIKKTFTENSNYLKRSHTPTDWQVPVRPLTGRKLLKLTDKGIFSRKIIQIDGHWIFFNMYRTHRCPPSPKHMLNISQQQQQCLHRLKWFLSLLFQTTTEDAKQEKKNDQPPQAKKPKVKTKTVELPIENNLQWQLSSDVLNVFVENEVML